MSWREFFFSRKTKNEWPTSLQIHKLCHGLQTKINDCKCGVYCLLTKEADDCGKRSGALPVCHSPAA